MSSQASPEATDYPVDQGIGLVDVAQFLGRHAVRIAVWVVLAGMLAGGAAVLLRVSLPRDMVARQTIRFTFDGAERGQYPNGTPFSPKDLLASPVLEQAFQALQLSSYLKPEEFAARLTIYQASRDMEMLQMEYQQKLGNSKLSQPERDSLERDFRAKMDALRGRVYTLAFDASGLAMTASVAERVVSKLPECWAAFAQTTRGVKNYDIALVTVAALADGDGTDLLGRAETLRSASRRLLRSADQLEKLPGGNLVRDSKGGSLGDLREEIANHYRVSVLPNYIAYMRMAASAQPERVRDAISVRISNEERLQKLATARADEIGSAFREYISLNSGAAVPATAGAQSAATGSASPMMGLGSQMPAIMSLSEGFFDRVIAQGIQSRDVEYRQELNERQIEAAMAVLEGQETLEFDRWVLEQLTAGSAAVSSADQTQEDAKAAFGRLRDFSSRIQELHRQLSERNLNAASQLYRNEDPVVVSTESAVSTNRMALGVFACCAIAFVLAVISGISSDRRVSSIAPA